MDIVKFIYVEFLYFLKVSHDLVAQKLEALFKRNKTGL